MQVTEHTDRTFSIYRVGNADGTISLFRKMSRTEAEFSVAHKSLQGPGTKFVSESFIKAASFNNAAVDEPEIVVEYRISKLAWAVLRAASTAQGAPNLYGVQFHHEGIYRMDTTQGGPFRNYGISNAKRGWFNGLIKSVRVAPSVDYGITRV